MVENEVNFLNNPPPPPPHYFKLWTLTRLLSLYQVNMTLQFFNEDDDVESVHQFGEWTNE